MTRLSTPVTRLADSVGVRDRGKWRELVITLYPGGVIGLRPYKTRAEEMIGLSAVYSLAIKQRVAKERAEKKAAKKGRVK